MGRNYGYFVLLHQKRRFTFMNIIRNCVKTLQIVYKKAFRLIIYLSSSNNMNEFNFMITY